MPKKAESPFQETAGDFNPHSN